MPKIRLLAPATIKDQPYAPGAEVDVDDATFADLRSRGMASSVEDEQAQAKAAQEGGSYTAMTGRANVGEAEAAPAPAPAPTPPEEEEPKRRR